MAKRESKRERESKRKEKAKARAKTKGKGKGKGQEVGKISRNPSHAKIRLLLVLVHVLRCTIYDLGSTWVVGMWGKTHTTSLCMV
jgi:hypothetical protein